MNALNTSIQVYEQHSGSFSYENINRLTRMTPALAAKLPECASGTYPSSPSMGETTWTSKWLMRASSFTILVPKFLKLLLSASRLGPSMSMDADDLNDCTSSSGLCSSSRSRSCSSSSSSSFPTRNCRSSSSAPRLMSPERRVEVRVSFSMMECVSSLRGSWPSVRIASAS